MTTSCKPNKSYCGKYQEYCFISNTLRCYCFFNGRFWTGYVEVPRGCFAHGINYDNVYHIINDNSKDKLPFELTYSGAFFGKIVIKEMFRPSWALGFDLSSAYYVANPEKNSLDVAIKNCKILANEIVSLNVLGLANKLCM